MDIEPKSQDNTLDIGDTKSTVVFDQETTDTRSRDNLQIIDRYFQRFVVDTIPGVVQASLEQRVTVTEEVPKEPKQQPLLHQYVYCLPNRISVVGIRADHPAIREGVASVNFKLPGGSGRDRSVIELSGKSKLGAQVLKPSDLLCTIGTQAGRSYRVHACMSGKLLEVNEKLKTRSAEDSDSSSRQDFSILEAHPETQGFIAVILPACKKDFERCLSHYEKL